MSIEGSCLTQSQISAVCGRLRKSNYFLERVHVPDRSGIRSCLGEREASLPQTATQSHGFASQPGGGKHPHAQDTKPWFCVAGKGGHAPPCPGHKVQVRHTQDPHYANLRFCVSGEGGHAPPTRDAKPPFCIANSGSGLEKSISTPMRRQKLSIWESA